MEKLYTVEQNKPGSDRSSDHELLAAKPSLKFKKVGKFSRPFRYNLNKISYDYIALHATQFSCSVMPDSLRPHGLQHARLPCSSPTPRACSNSCPLRQWCHLTISSSVIPFSSRLQSFPASESFKISRFLTSGDQGTGVSA